LNTSLTNEASHSVASSIVGLRADLSKYCVRTISDISWRQVDEDESLIIFVTKNITQFTVTDFDVTVIKSYVVM
jgi:hypothetical protein